MAESYTADGTEWTVHKKGAQFEVVRINRANGQKLEVAWVSPSATWAGKAAARQGYRQGRQDAINEIRRQIDQLQKGDPGPLTDDEPDVD